ncbi:MAG: hypothetical protein IJC48_03935 [Clostridia bacterium]|nr:hypothetical protein [Clostridia bacterium]
MAVRIAVLCVLAALICVFLRVERPEIAMAAGLVAGLTACLMALGELESAFGSIRSLLNRTIAERDDLRLILRACGLSLIGEYACQICRDAGEGALAQRIEFGLRVSLFALAAPFALELMNMVLEFPV